MPRDGRRTSGAVRVEYAFFVLLMLYLTPWILSEARSHDHASAILALNLATGWTVVGWLGALWWAGAGLWPERRVAAPALLVVPDPPDADEAAARRRARRLRLGVAAVLGACGLALAAWPGLGAAPAPRSERVEPASLVLRAGPGLGHVAVATLPRGCVVAVVEERGDWRRLWRTGDCPAGARGPASGWARGPVTTPVAR